MKRPLVWLAAALAAALVGVGLALARLVPPGWRGRALVVCVGLLLAVGSVMAFQARAAAFAGLDGKETPVRMTVLQEEEGPGYSMVTLYGKVQTKQGWKTTTLRASSYGIAGASLTAVLLVGMVSSALVQGNVVDLRTFEGSDSLLILRDDQAVLVDADREGAYQAALLAPEQVLYTFGQQNAQEAAILLQEAKLQAALLWQDTAREISPYLPTEITLLDAARPVRLAEGISLRAGEGYTLLELDGIRVLKIADGYVIIESRTEFPVAHLLVDGGGLIHNMAEPGEGSHSLRLPS